MSKICQEYQCSLQLAIDILGGKWKLRIIYYLLDGPQRFSDFLRRIPDISQKALTQQLRDLEDAKMISRKIYAEIPPKVEYSITPYGQQLGGILRELSEWAHSYAVSEHITVLTRKQPVPQEAEQA